MRGSRGAPMWKVGSALLLLALVAARTDKDFICIFPARAGSPPYKDYSEGLPGLFWRNFFGPPFVRMFGERLASLPEDCRERLGDGLVLVQPYTLPSDAGTEEGNARERALIEHLGPECFYDHEHHTPPTRRPVLDHLSESLH
ncbi:hypothetical protein [Archangium lipolyticum]|uniref:hypothetical protein n=1 Tax=Archangium lipolyticum TaxID=2970465 RepID=UPI00214A4D1E|nr:hypothetical protein [Archangium lipolyticum]